MEILSNKSRVRYEWVVILQIKSINARHCDGSVAKSAIICHLEMGAQWRVTFNWNNVDQEEMIWKRYGNTALIPCQCYKFRMEHDDE